jgi:hypothetical protein
VDFVRIPLEGEAESPGLWYVLRRFSALIDAEDEELVRSLGPWRVEDGVRRGQSLRAYTYGPDWTPPTGWIPPFLRARPMYLHDLVMGAGAGEKVWALNEDLLDCRKSNLRKNPKELMERRRRDWDAHIRRQREQAARDKKR